MEKTFDQLDYQILQILSGNSRMSYAEIGRKISLSQSATKERIQYLIDVGVIQKFGLTIDYGKLGYGLKVIMSIKFKDDEFKTFTKNLDKFPEITKCKRVTGEYCLLAECILKDSSHLENLIDRILPYGIPSTSVELTELEVGNFFYDIS